MVIDRSLIQNLKAKIIRLNNSYVIASLEAVADIEEGFNWQG